MKVQVLGTGCASCQKLFANATQAVRESGVAGEVEKVTDIVRILDLGPAALPALAVDGQVRAAGRVLTAAEIKPLLGGGSGGTEP